MFEYNIYEQENVGDYVSFTVIVTWIFPSYIITSVYAVLSRAWTL